MSCINLKFKKKQTVLESYSCYSLIVRYRPGYQKTRFEMSCSIVKSILAVCSGKQCCIHQFSRARNLLGFHR